MRQTLLDGRLAARNSGMPADEEGRPDRRDFLSTVVALGAVPALARGRAGRLSRKEADATPATGALQDDQGPDKTWKKAVRI